jgi:hypothetical protein
VNKVEDHFSLAERQRYLEGLISMTTVEKMARKLCKRTGKEMAMWQFFIPAVLGILDVLEEQPSQFVSEYLGIKQDGRISKDWKEMVQAIRAEHNVGRKS